MFVWMDAWTDKHGFNAERICSSLAFSPETVGCVGYPFLSICTWLNLWILSLSFPSQFIVTEICYPHCDHLSPQVTSSQSSLSMLGINKHPSKSSLTACDSGWAQLCVVVIWNRRKEIINKRLSGYDFEKLQGGDLNCSLLSCRPLEEGR